MITKNTFKGRGRILLLMAAATVIIAALMILPGDRVATLWNCSGETVMQTKSYVLLLLIPLLWLIDDYTFSLRQSGRAGRILRLIIIFAECLLTLLLLFALLYNAKIFRSFRLFLPAALLTAGLGTYFLQGGRRRPRK